MKRRVTLSPKKKNSKKKGTALLVTFGLMAIVSIAATTYIDRATSSIRLANHNLKEVQTTHLCEAGIQTVLREIWRPFKQNQNFTDMDANLTGAALMSPLGAFTSTLSDQGAFAAGVISYYQPGGDTYARMVVVRSIGWIDRDSDGVADADEPRKTVDVTAEFRLARSKVFDYTYFINNFGWMEGFQQNWLIVNGDVRSNGNFDFINGTGTFNGSVIAAANDKLLPGADGIVNQAPYKWTNSQYATARNNVGTPHNTRMRPIYDPAIHGVPGSAEFNKWRDLLFQSDASLENGRIFGAVIEDSSGSKGWQMSGGTPTYNMLDPRPTSEVIMPDLRDFGDITDAPDLGGQRFARSKAYVDEKEFFLDGTANPNFSGAPGAQSEFVNGDPNPNYKGAFVDVWDSSLNNGNGAYKRVSQNGVVAGSALLIGTTAHPIRIHGPVAVEGDVAIAGTVDGQGTLYTQRNVHIIGSIKYKDPPDFSGNDMEQMEMEGEKKDFLGLAASQSIIMGNTTTFGYYPLHYMTPPFTKPRLDENGNLVPAFNANDVDAWGIKKYQSILEFDPSTKTAYKNVAAGGVNQVDAILYSNFVGGGNVGTAGGGMTLNGTIISRDEAIVTWSLPIRMNYDNRIREREITQQPLIDLDLPRSPTVLRSTWQDMGFVNK